MKKVCMFSFLALMICFLTAGCGAKKTVVCTNEMDDDSFNEKIEVTGSFDDNKVTNLTLDLSMTVKGDYVDSFDTIYSSIESTFKELEEDGVEVKTSKEDKTAKVNISIKPDKLDKANSLGITGNTSTPDEMKESFEKEGYKCK